MFPIDGNRCVEPSLGVGVRMKVIYALMLLLGLEALGSPSPFTVHGPMSSSSPNPSPTATVEGFPSTTESWAFLESYLQVTCDSHYIQVRIPTPEAEFSGMVYPQGLSKNSSCLKEYVEVETIEYLLPLRSCNTMMTSASEGGEQEYFNTIVLEPHPKLVTGHGKGFNIRCKQQKTMRKKNSPIVSMKILRDGQELSGEHVKIGDPLILNITIESKHRLPFIVTDCKVRDGLGWAEETLVNEEGCTIDSELMGQFLYSESTATVNFLAHKFPYSPSVYYACAVKICKDCHPPHCNARTNTRRKRDANNTDEPATIEVYDGLYVNEVAENEAQEKADETRRERKASGAILCFNQRDFALAIAISGLILMTAVILLIFILCFRRRRSIKGSVSGGSSVYSGGYTNTAYSHSS